MRRRPGACACWKIPAWMRATHILLGSPITMPWCSYTPTPTHHPMRIPSSSGAFLGATHDGKRLVLVSHWPGCCVRLALAPDLEDGSAYLYATRACATPCALPHARCEAGCAICRNRGHACGNSPLRPTPAALLELHTLQALDATLAEPPLREVGEGLFGADAVAADWHKDSALRSRVRRLVRRGDELMHGGYRRLAQLPMFRRIRGRLDPCESSLSKKPCFLESASIRPRGGRA